MAQTQEHANASGQSDAQKKLQELVRKFDTAMLVTNTPDGGSHARPMNVADVSDQGDVWFVSRLDSSKVDEVSTDDRALVVMQAPSRFLTLSGHASVQRDPKRVQALWRETWRVWFKDKNDPNMVLIHVRADAGEYWDNSGTDGLKFLFKAAAAYVSGKQLGDQQGDPDIHGKVSLR